MTKGKAEETPVIKQEKTLGDAIREFQEGRDTLQLPVCDICGNRLIMLRKNPTVSAGVGKHAHKLCWDALPEEDKQQRIDAWEANKNDPARE